MAGPKNLRAAYLDGVPEIVNNLLDVQGPLLRSRWVRGLGIHEDSHAISVFLPLQSLDPDDIILSAKRLQ